VVDGAGTLARARYLFVCQDLRGKYGSEGTFSMIRPTRNPADAKAIDETTDAHFLQQTLQEAAVRLPAGSPNDGLLAPAPTLHRLGTGRKPVHGLMRRLCDASELYLCRE
jgi:hypothetical protein